MTYAVWRLNLEEDKVGTVLFGDFQKIKEANLVKPHRPLNMQVPSARPWLAA